MSTRYAAFALLCLLPLILLDELRLFARAQGGVAPILFDPLPSFLGTIGFVLLAKAVVPDRWRMASFDWLDVWATGIAVGCAVFLTGLVRRLRKWHQRI